MKHVGTIIFKNYRKFLRYSLFKQLNLTDDGDMKFDMGDNIGDLRYDVKTNIYAELI